MLNLLTTNDGNDNEETNHSLKGSYLHSNLFLDKASQVLMKFLITTVIAQQYHEKFVYSLLAVIFVTKFFRQYLLIDSSFQSNISHSTL